MASGKGYNTFFAANPDTIGSERLLKSLILAGGFATRLRPLSCSKPKLLFPVVGTPLIDYLIEWLSRGNVGDTVLAVNHLSDKLRIEVGSRELGERVKLSVEATPLGTGGPLRLAAPMLGSSDPVLVVNGDVVSDINLKSMIEAHAEGGAEATISVFKVPDTRPFGLVTLDSNGRILNFDEKPLTQTGSGWINAGVYVLNQSVISMIPQERAVSLEREIFPALARRNELRGWRHEGFWYDIGKIRDYVRANMELLERSQHGLLVRKRTLTHEDCVVKPSFVGDDCEIGKNVKLGPRAILSPNVSVLDGASVRDSIIFEGTVLGEGCHIEGAVIGEGTTIGDEAVIGSDSVIAGQVRIPRGASLRSGSLILN